MSRDETETVLLVVRAGAQYYAKFSIFVIILTWPCRINSVAMKSKEGQNPSGLLNTLHVMWRTNKNSKKHHWQYTVFEISCILYTWFRYARLRTYRFFPLVHCKRKCIYQPTVAQWLWNVKVWCRSGTTVYDSSVDPRVLPNEQAISVQLPGS